MKNWKKFQALFGQVSLAVVILTVAACGGGGGSSSSNPGTPTTPTTPPPTTPVPPPAPGALPVAITVSANAGAICETYLNGATVGLPLPCPKYDPTANNGAGGYVANTDNFKATLDGHKSTSSDPSAALTYNWTLISTPAGSSVTLTGADTVTPSFSPDVAGTYVAQLVVTASGVSSQPSTTAVLARDDKTPQYPSHGGVNHDCTNCHNDSSTVLRSKSSTHIASSNVCIACHATSIMATDFNQVAKVDHTQVVGTCSSCHNGTIATGKNPDTHITTDQECDACHTTDNFLTLIGDGAFDHSQANGPCSSCHNGVIAIGTGSDPKGHLDIGAKECNACHSTVTFKNPFVDHDPAVVTGYCNDCHTATGSKYDQNSPAMLMPDTHPVTQETDPKTNSLVPIVCDVCHDITDRTKALTFKLNGVFDHAVLARHPVACKNCHDGTNAKGVPDPSVDPSHPSVTNADCGDCHTTDTFANPIVNHSSFVKTETCARSGCHDGVTIDQNTGNLITGKPADPVHASQDVINAGLMCGTCHWPAGGTFLNAVWDHTQYDATKSTENCGTCHNGTFQTGMPDDITHTSSTAATGGLCGVCHNYPPAVNNFKNGTFDHSSVTITGVVGLGATSSPTCASCHDGTTATGKSSAHIPTPQGQDCVVCHGDPTVSGSPSLPTGASSPSFKMTTLDHTVLGTIDSCNVCHNGKQRDSIIVTGKPTGHIPTDNADCSLCHNDTTTFTTADLFFNKNQIQDNTVVHNKYTMGCKNCHNGHYTGDPYKAPYFNTNVNNTNNPSTTHQEVIKKGWDCNACHSTTGGFAETNPVNHATLNFTTSPCLDCHVDWDSTKQAKPVPDGRDISSHPSLATTTICQNCHAPGGSFTAGFDHTTLDPPNGVNVGMACLTCHDGLNATGKPQNHLPTSRDCVDCHADHPPTATSFAGGTLDHHTAIEVTGTTSAVAIRCDSCHGANILAAVSKPSVASGHPDTTSDCRSCHSVDAWKPATTFDHSGTTKDCQKSGCHTSGNSAVKNVLDDPYAVNGITHIPIFDKSLDPGKYPTQEVDCINCHTAIGGTFATTSMNHAAVTKIEDCGACHDGKHDGQNSNHRTTTYDPNTHFVSSVAKCASCHGASTTTWSTDWTSKPYYQHTGKDSTGSPNGLMYPGDHDTSSTNRHKVTQCIQCHKDSRPNANITGFPDGTYGTACAACHSGNYSKGADHHFGLPTDKDCSGSCHDGHSPRHHVNSTGFG